jgi:hypothetical protein
MKFIIVGSSQHIRRVIHIASFEKYLPASITKEEARLVENGLGRGLRVYQMLRGVCD